MQNRESLDQGEESATWWSRPAGGREVLQIALPLVVSALSWTVMTFVDRVFLKWESGTAMTAAFSASTVWFMSLCLPLGICTYANTFVSQYFGNGQNKRIGPAMWQGVWSALLFSPLMLSGYFLAPTIFQYAGHEPEIFTQEVAYFQILCFGAPGMLIAQAFSSFYSGRGKTSIVMCVDALCAIINLVLDYCWIFGYAGFPALGIEGAGWATVVSIWFKAAIYLVLVLQQKHRSEFATGTGASIDVPLLKRLLYFGGPSGLQMLLDVTGFTMFILLVSRLGEIEAEATSMAFSIGTLAFMPIWGLGLATGIMVGQHLGENRDDLAARATWNTLILAWTYMAIISFFYLFTPGLFLSGFFAGSDDPEKNAAVYELAVRLLQFVAAYNLFDAALMVFVNAIKGAGDTLFLLWVSLIMASTLTILSYLGVEYFQLGILGCWVMLTLWVCALGIIFFLRFQHGKWRSMRVIELVDENPVAVVDPTAM